MISMMKIASGEALWKYFQQTVAETREISGETLDYYTAQGSPSGRWIGSGVAGLNVREGTTVSPKQLSNLYGKGANPATGEQLARTFVASASIDERVTARVKDLSSKLTAEEYETATDRILTEETERAPQNSVAGFEMVFSPTKSVSILWGLAPESIKIEIKAAHDQAVAETVALLERDAIRTRIGAQGVAQVTTKGMVATTFDHWDSRDGDPQLHTHMLIANRVQGEDGIWRTLDSRHAFSPYTVTASEAYDRFLQDALSNRLGVEWIEITAVRKSDEYQQFIKESVLTDSAESSALFSKSLGKPARSRIWEIKGIPASLLDEFSQRTQKILPAKDELIAKYVAEHGKEPSRFLIWKMRSSATRSTRNVKHSTPLIVLTERWRVRAKTILGRNPGGLVYDILTQGHERLASGAYLRLRDDDLTAGRTLEELSNRVLSSLEESRTTWTRVNALAESHRALAAMTFTTALDRDAATKRLMEAVVSKAVPLAPKNPLHSPKVFSLPDGSSMFAPQNSELFTTQSLLDAEARLLSASQKLGGPQLEDQALHAYPDGGNLSEDQMEAINRIAGSGYVLDLMVGPAGAGKTKTLATLRAMWEQE